MSGTRGSVMSNTGVSRVRAEPRVMAKAKKKEGKHKAHDNE